MPSEGQGMIFLYSAGPSHMMSHGHISITRVEPTSIRMSHPIIPALYAHAIIRPIPCRIYLLHLSKVNPRPPH